MIVAVGIIFALSVMALIISLLLRRRLREKYAVLWLLVGVTILILSIFPSLLVGLAQLLGVAIPSNLIFALAIFLLVGVTLHLSWELSQAEEEVRRLGEEVAIIRADVEALSAVHTQRGHEEDEAPAAPEQSVEDHEHD